MSSRSAKPVYNSLRLYLGSRLDIGREYQFGLEYERRPKAKRQYFTIRKKIEAETEFENFLYLVSNDDLLSFLVREFRSAGVEFISACGEIF